MVERIEFGAGYIFLNVIEVQRGPTDFNPGRAGRKRWVSVMKELAVLEIGNTANIF